jgi:type IV pilus biogenesis protein PilP
MRNKTLRLWCSILAFGAPICWASENTPSGVNVGELAIIQSQTILLNAKAEKAKAERSINGEDQTATAQPSPMIFSQGNLTPPASASVRSADSQPELPVVKAVFGSAKRLRATLLYSGGVEIDADASSRELPGGYRVAILNFDNVTLERSGKRYPLGFSNTPPVVPGNANNPAVSNTASATVLPGLIPGQR